VALADIISETQYAFLKDLYILDSIITAYEILHHVHHTKEQGLLFKIDF
jgi:hypothetical protein